MALSLAPVLAVAESSGTGLNGTEVTTAEDGVPRTGSRVVPADQHGRHMHVVRFVEAPLARYDGSRPGLAATSPRVTGARLDVNAPAAVAYTDFLRERHGRYLETMRGFLNRPVQPVFEYLNVLNAVALPLTLDEADRMRGLPFVRGVHIDRLDELQTDTGPDLINAPAFWDGLTTSGNANRGEGVVIGVIDSGFNHSHPSFAEVAPGDGYAHTNPLGDGVFLGACADGAPLCNNKLIGAYNFHPDDSAGPEDTNSHGTHVGSTAGGNPVTASFQGIDVDITGVAPRANLINYKVCEPTCPQTSSVAAVNQAIADGVVDVLNFSISGSDNPWNAITDLAFLDAHAAGIFVAASAGNDGPGASTVAKTGPWNAAVAASTHSRLFAQELSVTGGVSGIAAVPGTGPTLTADFTGDLRYADDVDPGNFEGCDSFPAGSFDGEAALISRGSCAFATKVDNAEAAGAVLVVIFNSQGGPPIVAGGLENTGIPAVMVSDSAGVDLVAAVGGDIAEITVGAEIANLTDPGFEDVMAGFSSRGPSQFNLLKPDFAAPGVSILAAGTDAAGGFAVIGGTSMASPHAAGSAALIIAEHPAWTPAEVKSALALTGTDALLKENGTTPVDPHDVGSGRVDLAGTATIGFVMDETVANYQAANPEEGGEPATLNQPSVQTWRCPADCSFQRTIRSVVGQSVDYVVDTSAAGDMVVSVTPASFTLAPGESLTLDIDIDVSASPLETWLYGDIAISQAPETAGSATALVDEDFEGSFPPAGWSVTNDDPNGCPWARTDEIPMPNYAGTGEGAGADSDECGSGSTTDTSLFTPVFSLETLPEAELSFLGVYNHLGDSSFEVDITTDGGATWTNELTWVSDQNPEGPGIPVSIDLAAYLGEPEVQARFRYQAGWDWWANIDDVRIGEPVEPLQVADSRLPLAIRAVEPVPRLAIAPESLIVTQQQDEISTPPLSIINDGELDLVWELVEADPAPTGTGFVGPGVIWDNPQSGTSGRINNFSNPDDTGIYQADAFVTFVDTQIETIESAGFFLGGTLADATALNWVVFPDAGGVPAGDPETSPGQAVWSYTASVGDPGVSVAGEDMFLDLAEAGAPPLELGPGTWWLLAYPDIPTFSLGPNVLYAWFHGEVVPTGRQIGPGGLLGFPTDWDGVPEGRAFTLTGSVDCSPGNIPWLDVTPTSGTLAPQSSEALSVTADSTGLAEGTFSSALCVTSNDPDRPFALVPAQLNVVNVPIASISPESLSFTLDPGQTDSGIATISNDGLAELSFDLIDAPEPGCDVLDDVDWLTAAPEFGTVAAGATENITISADSTDLLPGQYAASVCYATNDDDNPLLSVAVELTVNVPAGQSFVEGVVESLGRCSAEPFAAAGAEVVIVGEIDTITVFADGNGEYGALLDSTNNSVDVTASAPEHFSDTVFGVNLVDGGTSVVDLSLVLDAGCATVSPSFLADTLEQGETTQFTLEIGNVDGGGVLAWAVQEASLGPATYTYGLPGGGTVRSGTGVDRSRADDSVETKPQQRERVVEPAVQSNGPIAGNLSEGFNDIEALPGAGWSLQNLSQPLGTTDWFQGNPGTFPAHQGDTDAYIGANFNNTAGATGLISNWLITPEMVLVDGTTLSFWTRVPTNPATWVDRLELRLSRSGASINAGTGAEDVGDFDELLLTVNPDLTATGYPGEWTRFEAELDGIGEPISGRFAFRYFVPEAGPDGTNSNYIGIDTVEISQPLAAQACENPGDVPWLSVSPFFGSVAPGGVATTTVTVDTTGLEAGQNQAVVCVNTDDPGAEIIPVVVDINVLGDAIFRDRFEQ